jgi:RNA polymerase sigma-70 factor (ECF subfamily)
MTTYGGKSQSDAEDLLQDAALKAFLSWERYDSKKAKFTTWFAAIVRNCAIDAYRKRAVRPTVGVEERDLEAVVDEQFGYDAFSSGTQAIDSLGYIKPAQIAIDAIAWLPTGQREVFELEVEEVSELAMSEKLVQPLGTIKSRKRLARMKLIRELARRQVTAESIFKT